MRRAPVATILPGPNIFSTNSIGTHALQNRARSFDRNHDLFYTYLSRFSRRVEIQTMEISLTTSIWSRSMEPLTARRKPAERPAVSPENKFLVSRIEAAQLLSISERGVDYLISANRLPIRRIGGRVLISVADLRKYVRGDHPEPIVS